MLSAGNAGGRVGGKLASPSHEAADCEAATAAGGEGPADASAKYTFKFEISINYIKKLALLDLFLYLEILRLLYRLHIHTLESWLGLDWFCMTLATSKLDSEIIALPPPPDEIWELQIYNGYHRLARLS